MFTEREINNLVSESIKSVLEPDNEPITEQKLTEIISRSISSCLLSQDFISYVREELAHREVLARRGIIS